ncbi:MAG: ribonuclease Z [Chloroflexi bacterium]|nr:ribonuclease Z [Chloroflexota bacterium]
MLDVALVGTGGMMPMPNRWLSSVLLRYGRHLVLFDCGEGTQISLRMLRWGLKDIDLILISHLHGDHVGGLPGLLLTQGNSGRTEPLEIVGPPGLARTVEGLRVVAPRLPFQVHIRELHGGDCFELDGLVGTCVEAQHHVPCLAYRLEVQRARRFLPARARELGVPLEAWKRLQHGESVGDIKPDDVLGAPRRGVAVGLVTDTRPTSDIAELVKEVDLLVCEAMYGSDDDQPRAVERGHMTFREAATLANQAAAKMLMLTHFSPSIANPEVYAPNALEVFPNTIVGRDRLTLSVRFSQD